MKPINNYKGIYKANTDMPIKYIYQLGGGIKGRTIKKGDTVSVIGHVTDIGTVSIETVETLYRINAEYFLSNFTKIS